MTGSDLRLAWIMARISPYYRAYKPMWLSLRDYTVYAKPAAIKAAIVIEVDQ